MSGVFSEQKGSILNKINKKNIKIKLKKMQKSKWWKILEKSKLRISTMIYLDIIN